MTSNPQNAASLDVLFLGSGSSGNSTLVRGHEGALLIDCGFSARETLRRLALHSVAAEEVRAVLVTHEHSDHVCGLRVLAARLGVPVYATPGTRDRAALAALVDDLREVRPGREYTIAGMRVRAFRTSHDAADPVGYRIDSADGRDSFGLATDTGHVTPEVREALRGCTMLGIECNHDEEMLERGPYPWFLKRRIASHLGHLSNAAAGALVRELAHDRLRAVFGLHLSRTNNEHGIVSDMLSGTVRELGLAHTTTRTVAQDRTCSLPWEAPCRSVM